MSDNQTLYFPCTACGERFAQVEEPDKDLHTGETYHCNECGAAVVFTALSIDMIGNPALIPWNCYLCKPGPCRFTSNIRADAENCKQQGEKA